MLPMAQQRIRPTTISAYNNLQPIIASTIAIYMGLDTYTVNKILAGFLIFGGVYLVTMSKGKAELSKGKSTKI